MNERGHMGTGKDEDEITSGKEERKKRSLFYT
jgi:hypothetical protein